jgi:uncharacterized protein (TIGR02246 family)
MSATDEAEIRALHARMMDGWNQGSGEAFAEPFSTSIDFVGFDGTCFGSRDELIAFHTPLFATHLRGSRLVGEVVSVRFLSPTVAVLRARGTTIMRGRSKASAARESMQTMVAVKEGDRWSLTAFQNTRVRPIGHSVRAALLWLVGDWLWSFALPRRSEPGRPTPLATGAPERQAR